MLEGLDKAWRLYQIQQFDHAQMLSVIYKLLPGGERGPMLLLTGDRGPSSSSWDTS